GKRLAVGRDELHLLAEDAIALERGRLQHVQKATVALTVQVFDGQLVGLELVSTFLRVGAGERQVEAERHRAAGRVVAEVLRPGSLGKKVRCCKCHYTSASSLQEAPPVHTKRCY